MSWTGTVPDTPAGGNFTTTSEAPVAHEWLDRYGLVRNGNYEAAANGVAANGLPVWECYVADLNPTNSAAQFRANIALEGEKVIVTWDPNSDERTYVVEGREALNDASGWTSPTNAASRFFRVKVSLPAGHGTGGGSTSGFVPVTLTFDATGGVVDPTTIRYTENGTLGALPSATGNGVFLGWYSKPNGGVMFTADTPVPQKDMTLYARWRGGVIRFDPNGGTGAMSPVTYTTDDARVTLPNCAFTKEGHTFAGWAAAPDGAVVYGNRATISPPGSMTLHAVWQINQYTVSFNTAGGNVVSSITQDYGTAVTAPADPVRAGYAFTGWSPSVPATMPASNILCTAQWALVEYTVHFNAGDGGAGTMGDCSYNYEMGSTTLPSCSFTKDQYTFAGWATEPGGEAVYGDGAPVRSIIANGGATNVTLYAKWNSIFYKVKFNANGGTGTMDDQTFQFDTERSLNANAFIRTGYVFVGWATQASGSKTYDDMETVLNLTTPGIAFVNLYAVWTPATYCVIDLSAGANASSYPVTHLAGPPSGGFNVDEYKTTKLVLKQIDAGSFQMGGSVGVTLTKPFFIGLFEVTQKQYSLVTGSSPSGNSGDTRPVEIVSYDDIRGSSLGSQWPASNAVDAYSFLGKLRARTGLDFDLPTEAQWEYACRAGTTTTFSYGNSSNGDYMWYNANSSDQTHVVGTKLPNPWGLYDMHGNVDEWCLDWYGTLSGGTDPTGSSSGSLRITRGGSCSYYVDDASFCTSSFRFSRPPSYGVDILGFRLSWAFDPNSDQFTVQFNANGGTGTMANQSFTYGMAKAMTANAFTRTGYTFAGWATSATGEKVYDDIQTVSNLTATAWATVNLYAKWKSITFTVTFNANGGSGTMANQSFTYDTAQALTANSFTRTGYTFAGWATSASGENVYDDMQTVSNLTTTAGGTVNLYAKWTPISYTVTFNANGGSGTISNQSFTYGTAQALTANTFTCEGYTFAGWATSATGEKVYDDQQSVSNLTATAGAMVDLYAVWTPAATPPTPAANGLIVRYYDISSSGYSTWTQSEAAMTNYFANYTPTIVTNTLDWGETLQSGFQSNNTGNYFSNYPGLWLEQVSTNRYHGQYANQSQDKFAMLFEGFLQIDMAGTYSFASACDDAIVVYIDGTRIVASDYWLQTPQPGSISLETGIHRITIATYEGGGAAGMWVEWKKPGDSSYEPLPQDVLLREPPPSPTPSAMPGLLVRYYDISSSGFSTWTQSEAAMTNYFAGYTPTIVTNTLDWGESLQSGFQGDVSGYFQDYPGLWLDNVSTNRYHGKYANKSQDHFAMFFEGELVTIEEGTYHFAVSCDNAMVFYIDGTLVCSFQWPTSNGQPRSATNSLTLSPGKHRISIATYESDGNQGMFVSWKKPGETVWSPLPQAMLFHATLPFANQGAWATGVYTVGTGTSSVF